MIYAPIAIFAYKRANHLAHCLATLQRNAQASSCTLYVFCDGPRSQKDRASVEEVWRLVDSISGFASVNVVRRTQNIGLARSIVEGVSSVLETHERVIVLEDDLAVSPGFLEYMNRALERYAAEERVASIHAYCYPVRRALPETFFLRGADCWGWATWRRAWQHFNPDGEWLLGQLRQQGLIRAFDLDGAFAFSRMLADQIAGRNDSWAVRWHASCFLANLLTLYPGRSLVHNTGNDASGTHSRATERFDIGGLADHVAVKDIPVEESKEARDAFIEFLRPSPLQRVRQFATRLMAPARRGRL
jgi:hypothetical protein